MGINIPYFFSDNNILNRACRIASGDIAGNCVPFQDGLLKEEKVCMIAGLDYETPWTRDTAINTMNALCISDPQTAHNTLLSVCFEENGKTYIGGQYWDAIIWALGAWQYYLVNSDREFLVFAADTIANTLGHYELEEFDEQDGLFTGVAVYGDCVAAYPDKYALTRGHDSSILVWPESNHDLRREKGYGIPMKALSTNCVYYAAYMVEAEMCCSLNRDSGEYRNKAEKLKEAINRNFWNEKTGRYDYFFDDGLRCDAAEGMGLAFAILFGIADEEKCRSIIENTYVTDHGIACVWPSFDRYRIGNHYGRHAGTVWPHIQGFWALAMLRCGERTAFEKEMLSLAHKANRDKHFSEIYHPVTGEPYGGLQENGRKGISYWDSCEKQTWSATAFWAMVYYGLFGLKFSEDAVTVSPYLPTAVDHMELKNLTVGKATVSIIVDRSSDAPSGIRIPKDLTGNHTFQCGAGR